MIHFSGTGPQKRLSSEEPRLSPIMKYIPAGILISVGKSHPSPPPQGSANGSFWSFPFKMTLPSSKRNLSPGPATMRLMKFTSARWGVGLSHGWPAGGWPEPQVLSCSAPAGGWKTTTSPTSGVEKRAPMRLTSTRWPTWSVGTIDSLGIRYGLTRNAWMPRARPRATATIMISSSREPDAEDDPFLVATPYCSLACLLVTGGRRLSVRGRVGVSDLGVSERLLVDGLTRYFSVGRCRGLRRRVIQQAALDDLLRTRVAALAHTGALADAATQVVELRAPDVAAGGDLDLLDLRRVQGERALDTDAEGLLAHREGLTDALALALDDDAFEDLRAAPRALDDLEVDLDAVPGLEAGDAAQLRALEGVDYGAHKRKKGARGSASRRAIIVADRRRASVIARAATRRRGRDGRTAAPREPPSHANRRGAGSGGTPGGPPARRGKTLRTRAPPCRAPPGGWP